MRPAAHANRTCATDAEFWPDYPLEHAEPATRLIHFAGAAAALLSLAAGIATGDPRYVLLGLVAGYGPAWFLHFLVEKNRPATFTYPLWSLVSDFRMAWCWLARRLDGELAKAGIDSASR